MPSDPTQPFEHPLQTMATRVAAQDWPESVLYVMATPIGNLGDLSLRAWHALSIMDVVAAEDTRATRILLNAWGLDTPLMSSHRHNETHAAQEIIDRLSKGQRVGLVTDAGAPAVSDPGAHVVSAVRAAGFDVRALPGPSAVITALMTVGVTTDLNPAFTFLGFAPNKRGARLQWLATALKPDQTFVLFESPNRIGACVHDMIEVLGPARQISLARELTKKFEQTVSLTTQEALAWLTADPHREQGEYVVLIHPQLSPPSERDTSNDQAAHIAWADALLEVMSVRDASKVMAHATGMAKDECYGLLLSRKQIKGSTRSE